MKNLQEIEILIVDDNANDAELTVRALRKHNLANAIFIAEDGEEALDFILCKGKYAGNTFLKPLKIIFLDLKLPKISGLEVLAEIKSNPGTKLLPVVIVSSSREDPDIKKAYELGANSYVVKPVNFEDFLKAMSQTALYWLLVNETNR